jgi:chemotaxis signal transduction protein
MNPAAATPAPTWCVVRAGTFTWRLPAADVLDIVFWPRLTRVPLQRSGSGPELLGVFEWQESVVPVLDIAGLPQDERMRVVIVRANAGGRDVPLGIAARDASVTDNPEASKPLVISEWTAALSGHGR